MRYLIYPLLVLVLNILCIKGLGQGLVQPAWRTPVAPNAAALARYVDMPVSKYTGTPNISIPIYTVSQNGFELPINISYHASGIKVNQEASSVGLGWVLNAGGAITRQINSLEDFSCNGYLFSTTPLPQSFSFTDQGDLNGPMMNSSNPWSPFFVGSGLADQTAGYHACSEQCSTSFNAVIDTESDTYYYNFGSSTGKFAIKKDGTVIKYSLDDGLKIELINHDFWQVKDQDGIVWRFKAKESTLASDGSSYVSSWYLSEIEFLNQEKINLSYLNRKTSVETVLERPSAIVYRLSGDCYAPDIIENFTDLYEKAHTPIATIMNEKYIESISWSSGQVLFGYTGRDDRDYHSILGDRWDGKSLKLTDITVKDSKETIVKTVVFNYSYFNGASATSFKPYDNLRLKLDGITLNADNYQFTYDRPDLLPSKTSSAYDHWGYYNQWGSFGIPKMILFNGFLPQGFMEFGSVNRTCNPSSLLIGTLIKIKYPTKGEVTFEYQPNDFYIDIRKEYSSSGLFSFDDFFTKKSLLIPNINSDIGLQLCGTYQVNSTSTCDYSVQWGPRNRVYPENPLAEAWSGNSGVIYFQFAKADGTSTNKNMVARTFTYNVLNGTCDGVLVLDPGLYQLGVYGSTKHYVSGSVNIYEPKNLSSMKKYIKGGGLRISKIISEQSTRNFYYESNDSQLLTSGKVLVIPNYVETTSTINCLSNVFLIHSQINFGLSDSDSGGIIGYSSVREETSDGAKRSVIQSLFRNSTSTHVSVPVNNPSCNGMLSEENYYSNSTLLMKKKYDFSINLSSPHDAGLYENCRSNYGRVGISYVTFYQILSSWKKKNSETTTEYYYDTNGVQDSTSKVVNFRYNEFNKRVNSVETIDSQGEVHEIKTTYPNDYTVAPYTDMVAKNMVSNPIETINLKGGNVVSSNLTTYKLWSPYNSALNSSNHLYLPDQALQANLIDPVSFSTFRKYDGTTPSLSSYVRKLTYDEYDYWGNIMQFTPITGLPTTIVYGYNNTLPIKVYENATISQVKANTINDYFLDFETTNYNGWTVVNTSKIQQNNYCSGNYSLLLSQDGSLTIKTPLGITPGNYTIELMATPMYSGAYIVFSNNYALDKRLVDTQKKVYSFQISSSNFQSGQVSLSCTGAAIYIDNIRIYPTGYMPLPFTAYTYSPLVGMTSQTDPNGITTFYEYDSFGRLLRIKDNDGKILKEFEYNYSHQ